MHLLYNTSIAFTRPGGLWIQVCGRFLSLLASRGPAQRFQANTLPDGWLEYTPALLGRQQICIIFNKNQ